MAQVITFADYVPPERFDGVPWTSVQIEEGPTSSGPFTTIDTIAISPVDADPANPSPRSFTTELASDTDGLWYRIVFLDSIGDDTLPTEPIQNIVTRSPYATVNELARILKIRTPTAEQRAALRRALEAASEEIDSEIDLTTPFTSVPALAKEVCLERAVEHWEQSQTPFGIFGISSGAVGGQVAYSARDSWERHALKLAPLKEQWGLA